GTTETRDSIAEQMLGKTTTVHSIQSHINDGSAWLVVEGCGRARNRRYGHCRLAASGWVDELSDTDPRLAAPGDSDWVLWEGDPSGADAWLLRFGWGRQRRIFVPLRQHDTWARPGFVLAASVGLVLSGKTTGVLAVTDSPKGRHFVRLTATA
ncbi:MAG TPA: hypothetical protein VIV60_03140, partial [Polyangiaceae bacterium]